MSATHDIAFSRRILTDVHRDVKRHWPEVNLRKDASVHHFHGEQWEFHGPGRFYDGTIKATNAYQARANGWIAYMNAKGVEVY